jgi:hypothetical protein
MGDEWCLFREPSRRRLSFVQGKADGVMVPPPLIHNFTKANPVEVFNTKDLGHADLNGNNNNGNDNNNNIDKPEPVDLIELTAKGRILALMQQAGMKIDVQ